jgi:ferredoxin
VSVDRALCQGYANCLDAAPDAFDLDDHDIAIVTAPDFGTEQRAELERAEQRCPARAISLSVVSN